MLALGRQVWPVARAVPREFLRNYSPRFKPRRVVQRPNLTGLSSESGLNPVLASLVSEPTIVIERQIEIGSIIAGFEQGRMFRMYRPDGTPIGYMQEEDFGFGRAIMRQITRLHRPFKVQVYDVNGNHALTIQRPFSFINSHIRCLVGDQLIGESQQEWHLWRRRYNMYEAGKTEHEMNQFGRVDAPFLSFDFPVRDENDKVMGSVSRNWTGIAREIFTDTGVYVLRNTSDTLEQVADTLHAPELAAQVSPHQLDLRQRVVLLATSVSIDFDYFSRHSNRGPMFMPFPDDI